ncbi:MULTISPECIES: ATP-binding protein [Oligella]|uniref:histidine kinase n=2 Tax=Oligella urethralis TaxID=90245 RepID=A0A2N6QEG7_9BURK|nr:MULTISPECIES: ATP-binding protein [Oligella]PMC17956.1 two-component sensor histidine kinase [Oligella urethralis]SPY08656.1 Osmolarity sensor protein EnvZ [Oligella urethralis]SUA56578.1 Osmolarity sensor protein EnvZ [Oligella urethralis]SUA66811.1 Osmolarity sensor protein EnvZ [Oligella urethralis]
MSVLRSNTLKDASTEPLQTEAASPSKTPKASKPHISRPQLRLGLFGRAFLIITAFMILSLSVWGMVIVNALEEHRADQLAERAASALNIAQKSIQYAAKENRSALTIQLATPGDTQVFPREPGDPYTPFGESRFESLLKGRLSQLIHTPDLIIASELSGEQGLWIGFRVEDELYWLLVKYRQELLPNLLNEGLSWLFITLGIALFGAALSVRMLTKPLKQLANASKKVARGENITALATDSGPTEIVELFSAFNQMAVDLRAAESDREVMLAGISHDLRTPLARMRLELELSGLDDEARSGIDGDMDQIEHCIDQLLEYARPTGESPKEAINISQPILELCERDQVYTESRDGTLTYEITPNIYANIKEINLIRVVGNLIENARRYGRSDNGELNISVKLYPKGQSILIDVADQGVGVNPKEIARLMRPFARGNTARSNVNGAGLGLAICKRLLQSAGGTISLLQNEPHGLLCRIELPKPSHRNILLDKNS